MPPVLTQILLVLHVAAAAYWFGAAAGLPRRYRGLLEQVPTEAGKLTGGMRRELLFFGLAPLVVFVTGLLLVLGAGGFAGVSPRIHAAMGLAVLWIGVGSALGRPAALRVLADVDRGQVDDGTRGAVRRLGMATGIGHLLFLVMLTLMLWRM